MVVLRELLTSRYAENNGIDNQPDISTLRNLCDLIAVVNCARVEFGKPIRVTSGYRCPAVNKAVGGKPTSAHLFGMAMDCTLSSMEDYEKLANLFAKYANKAGYNYVIFFEVVGKKKIPSWLHLEISKIKSNTKRFLYL